MQAPTAAELLRETAVVRGLELAWIDSLPGDSQNRHEEGGWIYMDLTTGALSVRRSPKGSGDSIDLKAPPEIGGSVVVATFHTHPNPSAEGWHPGPSWDDTQAAFEDGVPCLIRADNGLHATGPNARRGGLAGPSGFPG
jgi:hypothetical protein